MRALITGGSGFLGQYLLQLNDCEFITLGRSHSNIICNLSQAVPDICDSVELVIHAAGKAHFVPKNRKEADDFFSVNYIGTKNLLSALEKLHKHPRSFVFISTVAVYGREKGILINENARLNAKDPYGLSKIRTEGLIQKWCAEHHVICTILRLPLVVGQNPPGNLRAMIKGIQKGYYFNVAGGKARKSMVLAEDVAKFILPASKTGGIYNLTDGIHPSFKELSSNIASQLNKNIPFNIPYSLAKYLAKAGDIIGKRSPFNSYKLSKIKSDLTFDDTKARQAFNWDPCPVLENFKIK